MKKILAIVVMLSFGQTMQGMAWLNSKLGFNPDPATSPVTNWARKKIEHITTNVDALKSDASYGEIATNTYNNYKKATTNNKDIEPHKEILKYYVLDEDNREKYEQYLENVYSEIGISDDFSEDLLKECDIATLITATLKNAVRYYTTNSDSILDSHKDIIRSFKRNTDKDEIKKELKSIINDMELSLKTFGFVSNLHNSKINFARSNRNSSELVLKSELSELNEQAKNLNSQVIRQYIELIKKTMSYYFRDPILNNNKYSIENAFNLSDDKRAIEESLQTIQEAFQTAMEEKVKNEDHVFNVKEIIEQLKILPSQIEGLYETFMAAKKQSETAGAKAARALNSVGKGIKTGLSGLGSAVQGTSKVIGGLGEVAGHSMADKGYIEQIKQNLLQEAEAKNQALALERNEADRKMGAKLTPQQRQDMREKRKKLEARERKKQLDAINFKAMTIYANERGIPLWKLLGNNVAEALYVNGATGLIKAGVKAADTVGRTTARIGNIGNKKIAESARKIELDKEEEQEEQEEENYEDYYDDQDMMEESDENEYMDEDFDDEDYQEPVRKRQRPAIAPTKPQRRPQQQPAARPVRRPATEVMQDSEQETMESQPQRRPQKQSGTRSVRRRPATRVIQDSEEEMMDSQPESRVVLAQ